MFLAIAVDNLANAQELTAAEEEEKRLADQVSSFDPFGNFWTNWFVLLPPGRNRSMGDTQKLKRSHSKFGNLFMIHYQTVYDIHCGESKFRQYSLLCEIQMP